MSYRDRRLIVCAEGRSLGFAAFLLISNDNHHTSIDADSFLGIYSDLPPYE